MDNFMMYESARQFAKHRILSERQIRRMIEAGTIPGIMTDNGFKINTSLFLNQLENQSKSRSAEV